MDGFIPNIKSIKMKIGHVYIEVLKQITHYKNKNLNILKIKFAKNKKSHIFASAFGIS